MSNTLAVAAVTSTLRYVLEQALGGRQAGPVGGSRVTTLHPADIPADASGGEIHKGINVFLYQVTPNHAGNLTDLPTRRHDGSLAHRPTAALDLHYLLTFHGDDAELDAQRLLGRAVLALTVTPVLTRDVVEFALADYATETGTAFLADADLADQVELVKLAPAALSLEELGRLWSALGTRYRLALTYTATVVVLEADLVARTALPVRRRALAVAPAHRPRVDRVTPPTGAAISTGTTLEIHGSGLIGPGLTVRIGPVELAPEDGARADRLSVTLHGAVPAGVHGLQVIHRTPAGPTTPARVLARSNAVPVLVRPTVSVDTVTADTVTLAVAPPLQARQQASVTLSRLDGFPAMLAFPLQAPTPGQPAAATVDLDRRDVPDGTWLIRLSIDGAESLPALDDDTYTSPSLVLP
ncbi:Pvc16 family protein [Micromonospora sp. NPDC093277]|uniref:Pvc16 family protein n=1 Tax=Micromonospora sp. NPDC093277 TaxID=3364291 RepID=UPI0037F2EAA7